MSTPPKYNDNGKGKALSKNIPAREMLTSLIEDLLNKHPPTYLPNVTNPLLFKMSDNTRKVYQEIISVYPELLLFESFIRMYLPNKTASQIADEVLSPETINKRKTRERSKDRGLSVSNKILLDAKRIIFKPEELIKTYDCTISRIEFHSLLRIAHKRREAGNPVDDFFIERHSADNVKKLIAYSLCCIYEVGVMFREVLYKEYEEKTKTVKKMPESDVYYQDAQKLKVAARGKQIKKETIINDAEEFEQYLNESLIIGNRDRRFYAEKRFRYLTVLVIGINNFFKEEIIEPPKASFSLQHDSEEICLFSIDDYLNKEMKKPRQNHSVIIAELPALK